MITKFAGLVSFFVCIATVTITFAQVETIPEMIAHGVTNRVGTGPSGKLPSLTEVLRDTDLIVRGIVGQPRSYLSDDERTIYTDYNLEHSAILFQAITNSSPIPGRIPSVVVTQRGGTLDFGGVRFRQTENALLPLQAGSEAVFLLTKVEDKYHIARTFLGAFGVVDGRLKVLTQARDFAKEFNGVPANVAAEQFAALARSGHSPSR